MDSATASEILLQLTWMGAVKELPGRLYGKA
jgi:hypothetical protein